MARTATYEQAIESIAYIIQDDFNFATMAYNSTEIMLIADIFGVPEQAVIEDINDALDELR